MESGVDLEDLFHKNETVRKVTEVSELIFSTVLNKTKHFCRQHTEVNTCKAINALICGTIPEQVVAVVIRLCTEQAMQRCMAWANSKLRDIVFEEVSGGFERLRKAVRDGARASQSPHSATDTPRHHLSSHTPTSSGLTTHSLSLSRSPLGTISPLTLSPGSPTASGHINPTALQATSHSPTDWLSTPLSGEPRASVTSGRKDESREGSLPHPFSLFLELASSAMGEGHMTPSRDTVLEMGTATAGVREYIVAQVTVVEGGLSPHLLPLDTGKLLQTSIHLAALLVPCGVIVESSISTQLVSLWTLIKGLKQEVPIHILLSTESFTLYLQHIEKGDKWVWSSLSGLLVEVVEAGVAGVDVVEALWMVRIKQSSASKRQTIVGGAANFLAKWFGAQSLEKKDGADEAWGVFKDFCFVRLLRVVVIESDSPLIDSIRGHPSLPFLCL